MGIAAMRCSRGDWTFDGLLAYGRAIGGNVNDGSHAGFVEGREMRDLVPGRLLVRRKRSTVWKHGRIESY